MVSLPCIGLILHISLTPNRACRHPETGVDMCASLVSLARTGAAQRPGPHKRRALYHTRSVDKRPTVAARWLSLLAADEIAVECAVPGKQQPGLEPMALLKRLERHQTGYTLLRHAVKTYPKNGAGPACGLGCGMAAPGIHAAHGPGSLHSIRRLPADERRKVNAVRIYGVFFQLL